MGDLARLLTLLRAYRLLFIASIVVAVLSSVREGFTFVLLIPFLRALFGEQVLPAEGGSAVESLLHKIAGPFLAAGSPDTALRNVVLVVLGALVLKNATGYASAYWSAVIQQGVVPDLRMPLLHHPPTLPPPS